MFGSYVNRVKISNGQFLSSLQNVLHFVKKVPLNSFFTLHVHSLVYIGEGAKPPDSTTVWIGMKI